MKHTGFALILFSVIVLTVTIIFAVGHKTNRENEAENALDVAIENTMDNLMKNKVYTIDNSDQFIADFLEDLLLQMESDSSVNVVCKSADTTKGLLSMEITMSFLYNNGNQGQVSTERTVILEKGKTSNQSNDNEKMVTITYIVPSTTVPNKYDTLKTITVKKGSCISVFTPPEISGKTFSRWQILTGYQQKTLTTDEAKRFVVTADAMVRLLYR